MLENINEFYQIEIKDPQFLPGLSILTAIELLNENKHFKYLITNDLMGMIPPSLLEKEDSILKLEDFLKELPNVRQFDWGNFYLFKNYPSEWNLGELNGREGIENADTTLRAVDDEYIYVYTQYEEILNLLKSNYNNLVYKKNTVNNLDYPE